MVQRNRGITNLGSSRTKTILLLILETKMVPRNASKRCFFFHATTPYISHWVRERRPSFWHGCASHCQCGAQGSPRLNFSLAICLSEFPNWSLKKYEWPDIAIPSKVPDRVWQSSLWDEIRIKLSNSNNGCHRLFTKFCVVGQCQPTGTPRGPPRWRIQHGWLQ